MDGEIVDIPILQQYVEQHMTAYRFKHTLGVVETAKDLAVIYGVDSDKVTIAALFHDIAKEFTSTKKREFCLEHNIAVDDFLSQNIHLIHGDIAAYIAKEEYNIEDEDILNAIINHTLGSHNMSDLEKVIYIADIIEPNRKNHLELNNLRRIAYMDLNKAMLFALNYTINYLNATEKNVHPIIYSILEEYTKADMEGLNEGI
ncbi:MAG TPA: HD domain-containing protein [Epulopiscium sp.]|nr:HD domain-containing protein [Candidatus Epulonipiscium sp.]